MAYYKGCTKTSKWWVACDTTPFFEKPAGLLYLRLYAEKELQSKLPICICVRDFHADSDALCPIGVRISPGERVEVVIAGTIPCVDLKVDELCEVFNCLGHKVFVYGDEYLPEGLQAPAAGGNVGMEVVSSLEECPEDDCQLCLNYEYDVGGQLLTHDCLCSDCWDVTPGKLAAVLRELERRDISVEIEFTLEGVVFNTHK
jgi:hypothetical protein